MKHELVLCRETNASILEMAGNSFVDNIYNLYFIGPYVA